MIGFIDDHLAEYGVEPICRVLPIAPSTFYAHKAVERDPDRASNRAKRDAVLRCEVQRVWDQNFEVYGVRKVWCQMRREGFDVARCTVERLMRQLGIQGVVRGKPQKTTKPDKALPCPRDKVNPAVPGTRSERIVGQRLHLCVDLAGICLCGLRDRHLRQPDCRLAGITIPADAVCARCFGTGALRTAANW